MKCPVTFRIRVVKVAAGFDKIQSGIFTVCGGVAFNLSVKDSEWGVYHLRSEKEEILFRTAYGNASCRVKDLDGRKRIDFSEEFSILIEGYWAANEFGAQCDKTEIAVVKELTDDCEIAFMSTRESATNLPVVAMDPKRKEESELSSSSESDALPRPKGSVEIALAWMKEPVSLYETRFQAEADQGERERLVYEPYKRGERYVWEPELTAMRKEGEEALTGVEPIIRSVCMSQNLDLMYF